ncbi:hypothetical protein FALBO_8141 [Fusarium albosuccineum]|uniref:Uncharacterized protein n=1 Tax=Fusarium albosuccineum TaxID=1237068 RepID=A0A8H4PD44_9HYPO|nr:hypothetical protein FALBO_8141 [Fusarium albosuccineum]
MESHEKLLERDSPQLPEPKPEAPQRPKTYPGYSIYMVVSYFIGYFIRIWFALDLVRSDRWEGWDNASTLDKHVLRVPFVLTAAALGFIMHYVYCRYFART